MRGDQFHLIQIPVELRIINQRGDVLGEMARVTARVRLIEPTADHEGKPVGEYSIELSVPESEVKRLQASIGEIINNGGEVCGECRHARFFHFEGRGPCMQDGCTCIGLVAPREQYIEIIGDLSQVSEEARIYFKDYPKNFSFGCSNISDSERSSD